MALLKPVSMPVHIVPIILACVSYAAECCACSHCIQPWVQAKQVTIAAKHQQLCMDNEWDTSQRPEGLSVQENFEESERFVLWL